MMNRLLPLLAIPALLACGGLSAPSLATTQRSTPTGIFIPPDTDTPPAATLTFTPEPVVATAFPDPNAYAWGMVTQGLTRPVDIQNAGDGSGRLFVVEQPGRIRVIQNGQLLERPYLDINDRVDDGGNEQGLLGLAFHPDYEQNGFFYVNYTRGGGDTVIARFQVTGDPNVADPNSEYQLMVVPQPFPNHNGGVVAFGPDGYMYLGLGDGGAGGDPFGNAQSLNTLLGKILRIDVNSGQPYEIPPDNPFANGGGMPEIWAYGLRNPWRLSFDRASGDMFIADVGQGAWEEVNFLPAGSAGGADFGWKYREGAHDYAGGAPAGLVEPVAEYSHDEGGCSITGGHVYRGPSLAEWQGIYLYGDYCSGLIWGLIHSGAGWQSQVLFRSGFNISTFGEDEAGELYVTDLRGAVYRLIRP